MRVFLHMETEYTFCSLALVATCTNQRRSNTEARAVGEWWQPEEIAHLKHGLVSAPLPLQTLPSLGSKNNRAAVGREVLYCLWRPLLSLISTISSNSWVHGKCSAFKGSAFAAVDGFKNKQCSQIPLQSWAMCRYWQRQHLNDLKLVTVTRIL